MKIELDFYTCRRPELMTQKALDELGEFVAATGYVDANVVVKGNGHVLTIEWLTENGQRFCEQFEWDGATPRWRSTALFEPNESALDDAEHPCEWRTIGCDGTTCEGCRMSDEDAAALLDDDDDDSSNRWGHKGRTSLMVECSTCHQPAGVQCH